MQEDEIMSGAEILNEVAEMIIKQIRNDENYKDCGCWFRCFKDIMLDIENGRKLLKNIERLTMLKQEAQR